MLNRRKLKHALYPSGSDRFHVVLQHRRVEWVVFPFGMLRRHRLHPIEDECKLEMKWLLAPQGSVVIEDRDPIFGFDEVGAASRRHPVDKIEDAPFRRTFVPGRQRSRT
jgi:hypothetical protein